MKVDMTTEARDIVSEEPTSDNRRSFLGAIIGLIGAGISSVLGVTIGRYAISPALKAANVAQWIEVGLLEEIPEGMPVRRIVVVSQEAGWGRFNSQRLVWITRQDKEVKVFSATCPHLGCTISEGADGFICPCHNSSWSAAGEKTGGPAPRGMDTLEYRLEGDVLKVKYQYFRQGVEQTEEMG